MSSHLAAFSPGGRSDPPPTHWGGDKEGHASKLPIQLRDELAHSLGSTSKSRNDVPGSPSAITPQLLRGAMHGLLGGSDGRECGHEFLHDAKVVMDDRGQRNQAVGGAGGITDKS